MKRILTICSALLFAITLSVGAFAENLSKSVTIPNTVEVNGKTLPAGEYKVKVDTAAGSTAEVHFMKGRKEVASVPAQVKTLPNKPYATQIQVNNASSKARLDGIDFAGTTTAVRFAGDTASPGE